MGKKGSVETLTSQKHLKHFQSIILIGGIIYWWASTLLTAPLTARWVDFPVYFEAGLKALEHHTVYDVIGHYQFKYSPFSALFFGWSLSWAGFQQGSVLFHKISVLGLLCFVLGSVFRVSSQKRLWLTFVSILFFGNAMRLELELGQANWLPMLAVMYVVYSNSKLNWTKGLAFAFALQMKLYCVFFLPLLVFSKKYKVLGWTGAFSLVFTFLIPGLYHGVDFTIQETLRWFLTLSESSQGLLSIAQNVGIMGVLSRLGFSAGLALFVMGVFSVAWMYALYRMVRGASPDAYGCDRGYGFSLIAIVILNPLVWPYWTWFLTPVLLGVIESQCKVSRLGILLIPFIFFNMVHSQWAWSFGIPIGSLVLLYLFLVGFKLNGLRRGPNPVHCT